jgi:hypothetical protein
MEFPESRQEEFVLDSAMAKAFFFGASHQFESLGYARCDGFLGVDMFAGVDGPVESIETQVGGCSVKKYRKVGIGQGAVEIGRPFFDPELLRDIGKPFLVAACEQQTGHDHVIADRKPAFRANLS